MINIYNTTIESACIDLYPSVHVCAGPLAALPNPISNEEGELEINVACDADHDDKRALGLFYMISNRQIIVSIICQLCEEKKLSQLAVKYGGINLGD